jgi:hypothetical protein
VAIATACQLHSNTNKRCSEEARVNWTTHIWPAITDFMVSTAALLHCNVMVAILMHTWNDITAWIHLFYAILSAALKCTYLHNNWILDVCLLDLFNSNWAHKYILMWETPYTRQFPWPTLQICHNQIHRILNFTCLHAVQYFTEPICTWWTFICNSNYSNI